MAAIPIKATAMLWRAMSGAIIIMNMAEIELHWRVLSVQEGPTGCRNGNNPYRYGNTYNHACFHDIPRECTWLNKVA